MLDFTIEELENLDKYLEECKKEEEEKCKLKTYWYLPLDNYNQPNGEIKEIKLTWYQYQGMKQEGHYVYDSYMSACERAID